MNFHLKEDTDLKSVIGIKTRAEAQEIAETIVDDALMNAFWKPLVPTIDAKELAKEIYFEDTTLSATNIFLFNYKSLDDPMINSQNCIL